MEPKKSPKLKRNSIFQTSGFEIQPLVIQRVADVILVLCCCGDLKPQKWSPWFELETFQLNDVFRESWCSKEVPSWKYTTGWWFQIFLFSPRTLGKCSNLTNIFQMGWNHQLDNLRILYLDPPRGAKWIGKGPGFHSSFPWSLTAGTWNSGFWGIRKLWWSASFSGESCWTFLGGGTLSPKLTARTWKWMVGSDEWLFWRARPIFRGKLAVSSREGTGFKHSQYPAQQNRRSRTISSLPS